VTIQDVGSIGELVAAVATVATLAYLALQIRQSNRSNQHAAIARLAEGSEHWLGQIVQNETLYKIYRAGILDPETLSQEERGRFDMLVVQLLRSVESGWFQKNWGLMDSAYWDGFMRSVTVVVGSEAGRRAFAKNREVFAQEFAEAIEAAIAAVDDATPD
jgi:hypothetical protein